MAKNVRSLVGMLFFWIAWTGITGLGWTVTLVTIAAFSFSSAVWDPDEVEYYLNTTPFERIAEAMLGGVVFGIIGGLVVGILWWIVHKRVKGALLMAAGTLVGTALLCGIAGSGGPAIEVSEFSTVFRGAVVGGVLGGVLSGFGQWVLLRRNIKVASGWIVWTIAGWAVGWVVIMSLPELILGGIAEGRLSLIGNLAVAFIAGAIAGKNSGGFFGRMCLRWAGMCWRPLSAGVPPSQLSSRSVSPVSLLVSQLGEFQGQCWYS